MKNLILIFFILSVGIQVASCSETQNLASVGSMLRHKIKVQSRHREKMGSQAKIEMRLSRKRFTEDGRVCSSKFTIYGKTYTDCTSDTNPDGQIDEKKEWCYIKDTQDWSWCKPILDYDKIRLYGTTTWKDLQVEARRTIVMLTESVHPVIKAVDEISRVQLSVQEIDNRLSESTKRLQQLTENQGLLNKYKDQWSQLDQQITKLKNVIKQLEAQTDGTTDNDPCNCAGMPGYEAEGLGTGLTASYYNNEEFNGIAVTKIEKGIDFYVNYEEPTPGINGENFSIEWKGWLRVPKDSNYVFYVKCDGACWFEINTQIVVQEFTGQLRFSGYGNPSLNEDEPTRLKRIQSGQLVQSRPIDLKGGQKYFIRYKMIHTCHNQWGGDKTAFASLYWSSEEMQKRLIKTQFFYEKNEIVPPKIISYDPAISELVILKENIDAFKGSAKQKIQDVPLSYQGLNFLRVVKAYSLPEFKLELAGELSLLLAIEAPLSSQQEGDDEEEEFNPLDPGWVDTNELITVLDVSPKTKPVAIGGDGEVNKIFANFNTRYKIYKKDMKGGEQTIKFNIDDDHPSVNFLLFVTVQSQNKAYSCGGDEVQVSLPSNQAFKSCSQSSKLEGEQGWDCISGFAGKMIDSPSGMWASQGQGMGGWIQLDLQKPYLINRIEYMNRNSDAERVSEINVEFGNYQETFSVKNLNSLQNFKLAIPQMTLTVRIQIKQVYTTQNNGGAFNIYGVPCSANADKENTKNNAGGTSKTEEKQLAQVNDKVYRLKCTDTFATNKELQGAGLSRGDTVDVRCDDDCSKLDYPIYGKGLYTTDSAICIAAIHGNALQNRIGKFSITLTECPEVFPSNDMNGISSNSRRGCLSPSDLALKLWFEDEETKILNLIKPGIKMDIKDPSTKRWAGGLVKLVERIAPGVVKIIANQEGASSRELTFKYPSNDVGFCSQFIPDRECKVEEMHPDDLKGKYKFSFGQQAQEGYVLDSGKVFGDQGGIQYGWNIDSQDKARVRKQNGNPLLDNLMLFTPDINSKWCQQAPKQGKPPQNCQTSSWSVKVKPGHYFAMITVGDSETMARYDLQINGATVIGKFLKPNEYETIKVEGVNALDGMITITAKCPVNMDPSFCKFSWSRINTLSLHQQHEENKEKEEVPLEDKTKKLGCGVAFKEGRCVDSENIENCIYENVKDPALKHCIGSLMVYKIPHTYMCSGQRDKVKCAKVTFARRSECLDLCPGDCIGAKCITPPV